MMTKIFLYLTHIIQLFKWKLRSQVKVGKGVRFKGRTLLYSTTKNYDIMLRDNVTINSSNYYYHVNMFNPCKFFIDGQGAKIHIGSNSRVHGTCIHSREMVQIGENCLIAANTQIMDSNGHDISMANPKDRVNTKGSARPVIIGNNVWIGAGVVVLPGAKVGDNTVIVANSVVNGDIPSNCIAGGNPIQILKKY